jgi:putative transposase
MPRTARFVIPRYPFHITHRGNNKQDIFYSDEDRRRYSYEFEEVKQKYGMQVIAYCLMNNHVHFIAFAENEESFAKTINTAHVQYARYFNQKYGRVGHLWQGRYYSCILDESHLLAALRYVERNPVRANIVVKPWDWIWSSAREHLKIDKGIISLKEVSFYASIDSWRDYVDISDSLEDLVEIRKQTLSLRAWANDEFKQLIEDKYGIRLRVKPKGRPKKKIGTSTNFLPQNVA